MSLILNKIFKSFDDKIILCDFSYSFSDTGIYAVVGDSGVGKTTLLRMILGLDREYSGEIIGGGIKNCSFLFQEYRLFPHLNALDNVLFANFDKPSNDDRKKATELFLRFKFEPADLSLLPRELSGGMKQRVALIRAFIKNSSILLLDEPTKELDGELCEIFYDEVRKIAEKKLVIIVSHNENDIKELNAKVIDLSK